MPTKSILIDISDTLLQDSKIVPLSDLMIQNFIRMGLSVYLVSNDSYGDIFGIGNDKILYPKKVGGRKGTGKFVEYVSHETGYSKNEILYLGDTNQDMWEANNEDVLLLRADWSTHQKKTEYGIGFAFPNRVVRAVNTFFLKENLWYFSLDASDDFGTPVHYRSLLNPETAKIKGVRDLLKLNVKNPNLEKHLNMHLLASTNLEGLYLPDANGKKPIICLYPGHDVIQQTGTLDLLAKISKRLFNGVEFMPNLIIRHKKAIKSAFARNRGEIVEFENQLSTIKLNSKYRDKIIGRRILVFDDFTTEGLGFETARNFLFNAGAVEVFCISAGKYGYETTVFTPSFGLQWDSFKVSNLTSADFTKSTKSGNFDIGVATSF